MRSAPLPERVQRSLKIALFGAVVSRTADDGRRTLATFRAVRGASDVIDRGFGRDVLGDPFVAVAWLANHLVARREPLKAGHVVMTGSLVPTRFPTDDAVYRFDLQGIGSVSVGVSA
jgi:2-keto-4-pentenoate hydratase